MFCFGENLYLHLLPYSCCQFSHSYRYSFPDLSYTSQIFSSCNKAFSAKSVLRCGSITSTSTGSSSISNELESCGFAIDIVMFSHLLKGLNFDAVGDNLAITHIIKSKSKPVTNTLKRLLGILSYIHTVVRI